MHVHTYAHANTHVHVRTHQRTQSHLHVTLLITLFSYSSGTFLRVITRFLDYNNTGVNH